MYRFVRSILFLFKPEWVHYFTMNLLRRLCHVAVFRKLIQAIYTPKNAPIQILGLQFRNPIGLGAGFDKNACYLRELQALGFGHVEIGTVTPRPQAGNDKPRLFRLPQDKALINRMGFNNDGVDAVAARLKEWRKLPPESRTMRIGGNIGKNKTTPNEEAWKDYEICFEGLFAYVDYFVVNVSSPNTPGLRELQEKESLRRILTHLQNLNRKHSAPKPILLKIAPDLTPEQLSDVTDLAREIYLDGLVVANTTLDRSMLSDAGKILSAEAGAGGLSGAPLRGIATEMIRKAVLGTGGGMPVIGVGGIFNAADAREKLEAGACMVQVWTGLVYEGPAIVKRIVNGLRRQGLLIKPT